MFLPRCQESDDRQLRHWQSHENTLPSSTVTSLLMSRTSTHRGFYVNFPATNTKGCNDDNFGSKGLENWQKRHPSQWSAVDVLDLIYFIAYACKEIDVSWVSGEHFQHVDGYKLCRMSKKEFVELEPRYGELLYDTVHELLERSNFKPPKLDDNSFLCEPLDFIPEDCRSVMGVNDVTRLPPAEAQFCELNSVTSTTTGASATTAADSIQLTTQIPKCVEEMNDDDTVGNDDPNLHLSHRLPAAAAARGSFYQGGQSARGGVISRSRPLNAGNDLSCASSELLNACRYSYDNDSQPEFRLPHHPERVSAESRSEEGPLTLWHCGVDSSPAVYLDISEAHPTVSHVTNPAPMDLRTGRQMVTPSQLRRSHPDANYDQSRLLPLCVPQSPTSLSDEGGAAEPSKRKLSGVTKHACKKRPRVFKQKDGTDDDNDDDNGVGDVSGGGRHLWEFIRDLLRAGDRLRGGRGTITLPGTVPDGLPVEIDLENVIRWENREEGVFRIIDSKQVAQLWGRRKHNRTMTYEKLSRALRWCRKNGFFDPLPKDGGYPKKLCFRFGPLANNWRGD